jgi:hypothetical protein
MHTSYPRILPMDDCHLGYIRNFLKRVVLHPLWNTVKRDPILRFNLPRNWHNIKLRTRV